MVVVLMLMLLLEMVMKMLSLPSLPAPETSTATAALLLRRHCPRCCRRRFHFCEGGSLCAMCSAGLLVLGRV